MKKLLFGLLTLSLFISCKKKDSTQTSNISTGNITGKITYYNQSGEKQSSGLGGITVSLDNDNVTATSDDAGNYTLSGVKPGIYTIFYSKTGCGTYQIQQVNFPGNGTLYKDGILIESATFSFQSATIEVAASSNTYSPVKYYSAKIKMAPVNRSTLATIFISSNPDIDINMPGNISRTAYSIPANSSEYTINFPSTISGTFYVKIVPTCGYTLSYFDYPSASNKFLCYGPPLDVIKVN